jgi:CheY-like chemotaxis protein
MSIPSDLLGGLTAIIVDDDAKTLNIMRVLLEHYGASVVLASNGQEGLEQVQVCQPDFIISDLSMPIMDGWLMIRKLSENPATAYIPIIALTAHAMVGDREKALGVGSHHYLTKPIKPITFIDELVIVLQTIPALAERFPSGGEESGESGANPGGG